MSTRKEIDKLLKANSGIKLDLACGAQKQKGWVGMDILPFKGVDIIHDIEKQPFPLPDGCCSLILASHILEHIDPAKFGFVNLMNELWRITKIDGELVISIPYAGSPGYWQDPTHCNGCNNNTWRYFDPLDPSGLYRFYEPKPWRIDWDRFFMNPNGNMELVLIKRKDYKDYHNEKTTPHK